MKILNYIVYFFVYLLPKNFMSVVAGKLASTHISKYANKFLVKLFKIDMSESVQPLKSFQSFQELFTRQIKKELRPINREENVIISPCDGTLMQAGFIREGELLQVKDQYYSVADLLLDERLALKFKNGFFCTIYLAPKNYHRFHMPVEGQVIKTTHIPGSLWPVNTWGVNNVNNLFIKNDRVVSLIEENKEKKLMAHVAVGACLVGKIKIYYRENIPLDKGEELGMFMYGSTIVLLFENYWIKELNVFVGEKISLGQALVRF